MCTFFPLTHLIPSALRAALRKSWQVCNPAVDSDGSENITGLDLSDFPALADRSRRDGTGNPTPVLNPLAGRAPYGRPLVQKRVLFYPSSSRLPVGGIISNEREWWRLNTEVFSFTVFKSAWWQNHQLNRRRISPSTMRIFLHCPAQITKTPRWTTMKARL